jgi:hypothetical protein
MKKWLCVSLILVALFAVSAEASTKDFYKILEDAALDFWETGGDDARSYDKNWKELTQAQTTDASEEMVVAKTSQSVTVVYIYPNEYEPGQSNLKLTFFMTRDPKIAIAGVRVGGRIDDVVKSRIFDGAPNTGEVSGGSLAYTWIHNDAMHGQKGTVIFLTQKGVITHTAYLDDPLGQQVPENIAEYLDNSAK